MFKCIKCITWDVMLSLFQAFPDYTGINIHGRNIYTCMSYYAVYFISSLCNIIHNLLLPACHPAGKFYILYVLAGRICILKQKSI